PVRLEHGQQQRARQLPGAGDSRRRRERRACRRQECRAAGAHAAREPAPDDPRKARDPAGKLRRQHGRPVRGLSRAGEHRMRDSRKFGRRRFLGAGLERLAALASVPMLGVFSGPAGAQAAPAARALSDKLVLIGGVPGNVLALSAEGGIVLVDSGAASFTRELEERLDGAAVHTVINTHYHGDQTGGNAHFGAAGAKIRAHEITRQWLSSDYYVPAEDRWVPALPPDG